MKHYIVKYEVKRIIKSRGDSYQANIFRDLLIFDPADSKREAKMAAGKHSDIFTDLADVDNFVLRTCGESGFRALNKNAKYMQERLGVRMEPDNKARIAKSIRLEREGFL